MIWIKEEKFELDLVSCNKFSKNFENFEKSIYNLTEWKCPDFSNLNKTIELGNFFEDNWLSYLLLELRLCSNKDPIICKNTRIINEQISKERVFVSLIYPEIIFNADNYKEPYQYKFKNYFNIISQKLRNNDEYYYGYNHLSQDAGFIFESEEENKILSGLRIDTKIDSPAEFMTDNSKITQENNSIYNLFVFFDKYYKYHFRKYMKLQDLLGNVYGFMDLIILIFGFIYNF